MFKELANDENIRRLEIDPALIRPYKNVMRRLEIYFQKRGYTQIRDYQKLFEEALLMPPEDGNLVRYDKKGYFEGRAWKRKFAFEITDEPSKTRSSSILFWKFTCWFAS
jgi:hypothetical protein